jgi:hypothetical protein
MSETPDPELPAEAEQEGTEQAVRAMLRGARDDGEEQAAPDLVRGVQQKIRVRSGGKFYADGWSTVKHPPLATYLITSLLMLFVLVVIYALLAPLSGPPELARPPKPIQVMVPVGQ